VVLEIGSDGRVFMGDRSLPLPYHSDVLTLYVQSGGSLQLLSATLGLQVQVQFQAGMHVYVTVQGAMQGQLKGLCGNLNRVQADDFVGPQGSVEATGQLLATAWSTSSTSTTSTTTVTVPLICRSGELSELCDASTLPAFHKCLQVIDFAPFTARCKFESCHCGLTASCRCASLEALARACSLQGAAPDSGWRGAGGCEPAACPSGQLFSDSVASCRASCHGLARPDSCLGEGPSAGCVCPEGQLLLEPEGSICVSAEGCPCYAGNRVVPPGQSYESGGQRCVCQGGVLNCGSSAGSEEEEAGLCVPPMVYANCSSLASGELGKACERSCGNLHLPCVSGEGGEGVWGGEAWYGAAGDGDGGSAVPPCVLPQRCPCRHDGRLYGRGDNVTVDCNTCTCGVGGAWSCSEDPCPGTCSMYGDGHFVTFDGKRFVFDGKCHYGVVQDYCANQEGSFQIITDNEECGTAGTACSKSVRFFIKAYKVEVRMADGEVTLVPLDGSGGLPPSADLLSVHSVGLYRIVQAAIGVVVMWDRRTSIFVKLDSKYKGKVCGLCGNFNGDVRDDFTTRDGSAVASAVDFGNGWRSRESCTAVERQAQPCAANPYRLAWAQRKCSVMQGDVFGSATAA
ncbi:unnamed protein product, partial [Lampetra fluviatilis]